MLRFLQGLGTIFLMLLLFLLSPVLWPIYLGMFILRPNLWEKLYHIHVF